MNDRPPSLATVLNFVNSFHEQCRNIVRDTTRLLRDDHQLYLRHHELWDYNDKPNDRFLTQPFSTVRRTWSTLVPAIDTERGALFSYEFFKIRRFIEPVLTYGAVYPGSHGFDAVDRWTAFNTIKDAEKNDSNVRVVQDGPIAVVSGVMPKQFEEATLICIPVDTVVDQSALERVVVNPLAALLQADRSAAKNLLADVKTELWPSIVAGPSQEEEDDSEQA